MEFSDNNEYRCQELFSHRKWRTASVKKLVEVIRFWLDFWIRRTRLKLCYGQKISYSRQKSYGLKALSATNFIQVITRFGQYLWLRSLLIGSTSSRSILNIWFNPDSNIIIINLHIIILENQQLVVHSGKTVDSFNISTHFVKSSKHSWRAGFLLEFFPKAFASYVELYGTPFTNSWWYICYMNADSTELIL